MERYGMVGISEEELKSVGGGWIVVWAAAVVLLLIYEVDLTADTINESLKTASQELYGPPGINNSTEEGDPLPGSGG